MKCIRKGIMKYTIICCGEKQELIMLLFQHTAMKGEFIRKTDYKRGQNKYIFNPKNLRVHIVLVKQMHWGY